MGQHRTDECRRRGISRGLSLTILAVIVVVALVVGWNLLGNSLSDDGDAAARTCVEGEQTVTVLADADIAAPLATIAQAWSATRPVIRDACVTLTVRPSDPKTTLEGLTGTWDAASMGEYPAAWVPASSVWSAQLLAARSAVVDGDPESLVSSPVVLAVAPELARAAAGRVSWIELPTLQRDDDSLAGFGLRGWSSLRMARASGPGSDATVLASQAVATEVGRATADGLTVADAQSQQVTSTLGDLRRRSPVATDGSAVRTLTTIAGDGDPAGATVHAVPITEQALYAATRDTAQPSVVELRPTGATPSADHPVIDLTGPQVNATQAEAVGAFFRFARTPEQLRTITALGFRGGTSLPARTAAVSFGVIETPMPAPEPAAGAAIARLVLGG
ncbi:substrate-binding domain-containing protein [Williamsia sp. M5A3_1d]